MSLECFHPLVRQWFLQRFEQPTEPQVQGWPEILAGHDTLIAAPTGSGKTLAAFLSCIHQLVQKGVHGQLRDETEVVYISPLKALGNDIQKNLREPLAGIRELAEGAATELPEIRVSVRSGDTLAWERQRMVKQPPHILVTTPESLYILLTADKSRRILRTVRTVIVDEIHAVVSNKRGSHLALSLERLEALAHERPARIGLSATQRPFEEIARYLVGTGRSYYSVNVGHRREMDLAVEVPRDELGAVASNELWGEIYDRLAELVRGHRTTLVFVNTRRMSERVSHHLAERLGPDVVAAHHGSLSRRIRLSAEDRLKQGELRAVVATASLELGIDIGAVDLVCQIGSPRSIALCIQRVGRSGHWRGAVPKGRLFATSRDELLECAALVRAVRRGELDRVEVPSHPLDILAQQIVAAVACEEWGEDELFELCRKAYPYRDLKRKDFDSVVEVLSEGISARRGRSGAYLYRDQVHGRLRARRGARLAALTSGGAIPDNANYAVVAEPEGITVGTVDEDFAVESLSGDIFLLGNTSWRIRRVESGRLRVEDAHGAPPNIPFWRGEAPARTAELSAAVSALRREIVQREENGVSWLERECGLDRSGAEQAAAYVRAGRAALGAVPTQETVIAERFFDESGGMQLVLHAPFGGRINRAWGLALRKRMCRMFDFELQAAATDDGLILSLGEQHSFPLEAIFSFLSPATLEPLLRQAVLASPLFGTRWRWNASRFLALLRFAGGRKVPLPLQRMRSEDLMAAVFPAAVACADNASGEIQAPDHPLVNETLRDCLTEAMDLSGLARVLERIEAGRIRCLAVETPEPSPFSHEIVNARVYAFLDDAPLEERRARAVAMRRSLPPEEAGRIGALDAPAIEQVTAEAQPLIRSAEELHDALLSVAWMPLHRGFLNGAASTASRLSEFFAELQADGRATTARVKFQGEEHEGWVAAERVDLVRSAYPDVCLKSALAAGSWQDVQESRSALTPEEAHLRIVRGWMEVVGPTHAAALAARLHLSPREVEAALLRLETEGQVLRGRFTPGTAETEWCDRRLLARIHRLTLGRLRREIQPVSTVDFMRFLFRWQHVGPGAALHGQAGLLQVVRQLQGYEAAAPAWERHILPLRVARYEGSLLDRLCLSGDVGWGRLSLHPAVYGAEEQGVVRGGGPAGKLRRNRVVPTSAAPVALFLREEISWLVPASNLGNRDSCSPADSLPLSHAAQQVLAQLGCQGASFFGDLVRGTRRLKAEVAQALWELVAAGLVTADGFDSLRALVDPKRRLARKKDAKLRPGEGAGRWSFLRGPDPSGADRAQVQERAARQLLLRYGVVFRDLLGRETLAPPWRDLLGIYRRLEARGEIRGGRFVEAFVGEQYALPEAVGALRAIRNSQPLNEEVRISAADPLNLLGILLPGPRIPPVADRSITFRDGVPTAC